MSWNVIYHELIAVIAFNRPPENRIPFAALADLDRLLVDVSTNPRVSLVILTSNCPGVFFAGADLADIGKLRAGEPPSDSFDRWLWTLLRLERMPQPVVAAIDGVATSGGCEIALACTFRVGSPAAQFAQLEITRGAMPGAGGTQRLPRLIGPSRAAHLILTGRTVPAQEAISLGLLDALFEGPGFMDSVLAWSDSIAAQPRSALITAKQALVEGQSLPLLEGLLLEQRLFLNLIRPAKS